MHKLVPIILFIFLVSCNNNPDSKGGGKTLVNYNTRTMMPDSVTSADIILDTVVIPNTEESYPAQILFINRSGNEPGDTIVFHNDEVKKDWERNNWYALVNKDGKYTMQMADIHIEPAYDVIVDENESDKTGWAVTSDGHGEPIMHFTGKKYFKEGDVNNIQMRDSIIKAGDTICFRFNNREYCLFATGHYPQKIADSSYYYMQIVNYKLYIQLRDKHSTTTQLIYAVPRFDDSFPEILFIGDIDHDGKPDILMDAASHYNVFNPILYISSEAAQSKLLKVVAAHFSVGC